MDNLHCYGLSLVTPPAEEPLSLAEAKAHLRVDHDHDDEYIAALIAAARQSFEDATHRQLVTATYDLMMDRFPAGRGRLLIPRAPLASVASIKYIDAAGDLQTLAADQYKVSTSCLPGRVTLAYGSSWPTTRLEADAVTVRFTAGMGDSCDIEDLAKRCIKLIVGNWYENREESIVGSIVARLPIGVQYIVEQYALGDAFSDYGSGR